MTFGVFCCACARPTPARTRRMLTEALLRDGMQSSRALSIAVSLFEHDLFRKPLHTFRDHALAAPTVFYTELVVEADAVGITPVIYRDTGGRTFLRAEMAT